MKLFFILSAFATILLSNGECNKKKTTVTEATTTIATSETMKGRLEIKGFCYNYTIKLLEGSLDTSKISTDWTDQNTAKKYTNVFGLNEPCKFPDSIKVGDEFNFIIDTTKSEPCIVCNKYYPTPPQKLRIKVVEN